MVKSKTIKSIIKTDFNNVDTSLADKYIYYDKTIGGIEYLNLFKVTANTPKTAKTPRTSNTAKTAKIPRTSNTPKSAKTI